MSYSEGVSIHPRFSTIYFDDIHAKTLEGIEIEQHECQEEVFKIREKLAMLIASNPKQLMTDEDIEEHGTVQSWITAQINNIEEELQCVLKKYGRLEIYEQLLDEWVNGHFYEEAHWENLYEDIKDTSNSNIIFPEEKCADTDFKHDLLFGKTKLEDSSIEEAFERGMNNVKLDDETRNQYYSKVYANIDGQLFVTYKGQWLFSSINSAMEAIGHRLNIPLLEYVKKDFIDRKPEFFESLKKWLDENESKELDEYIENFNKLPLMSKEYTRMYDLVKKATDNYIKSRVTFHTVEEEFRN